MNHYSIAVQFVSTNAPSFSTIWPAISNGIKFFNEKSLTAKNRKQIVDARILNRKTLLIHLQSAAELPCPGKALRLFSSYFCDNNSVDSLAKYVVGRQLFKTTAEEIQADCITSSENSTELMRLEAISLILNASEEQLKNAICYLKEGRYD